MAHALEKTFSYFQRSYSVHWDKDRLRSEVQALASEYGIGQMEKSSAAKDINKRMEYVAEQSRDMVVAIRKLTSTLAEYFGMSEDMLSHNILEDLIREYPDTFAYAIKNNGAVKGPVPECGYQNGVFKAIEGLLQLQLVTHRMMAGLQYFLEHSFQEATGVPNPRLSSSSSESGSSSGLDEDHGAEVETGGHRSQARRGGGRRRRARRRRAQQRRQENEEENDDENNGDEEEQEEAEEEDGEEEKEEDEEEAKEEDEPEEEEAEEEEAEEEPEPEEEEEEEPEPEPEPEEEEEGEEEAEEECED